MHIEITRGDSGLLSLKCTNGEESYLDDGDILYLTVKKDIYTEKVIFQKVVTEFVDKTALIEICSDDTKNLKYGLYKYDIQLNKISGEIKTLIVPSDFVVSGEVTNEQWNY